MNEMKMIRKILSDFDWMKVYKYSNEINWSYGKEIQTIPTLTKIAKELLEDAISHKDEPFTIVKSEGFKVTCIRDKDGCMYLSLDFVIEDKDYENG